VSCPVQIKSGGGVLAAVASTVLAVSFLSGCMGRAVMEIDSVPAGASVSIERLTPRQRRVDGTAFDKSGSGTVGKYTPSTPCTIFEFDAKDYGARYQIRLSKAGYQDSVIEKSLTFNDRKYKVLAELQPDHVAQPLPVTPPVALPPTSVATSPPPPTPKPVPPSPPPIVASKPAQAAAPALVEKNPLRVKRWNYDQTAQKAEFEFAIVSEEADIFAYRPWALQEIRKICTEEYADANPGEGGSLLGFSLISELDFPQFLVHATVYGVRSMSHSYDAATRTGTLKVNIGKQGDANYAGTYKWALDNIGAICSSKEIGMTAGQAPPEGAMYTILSEKTHDDGSLEITFKVIQ